LVIPRERTELENIIVYGVDLKRRYIYFGIPLDHEPHEDDDPPLVTAFSHTSVQVAIRGIKSMEADHPRKPITIFMHSQGGCPYAMIYLKDVMEASSCQFKFYGGGEIMSAATWIMAISDERNLYEDTTVMVHNGSEGGYDGRTHDDFHIHVKESKRLMARLIDIYTANSKMPREFWERVCKRDLFITAEKAIEYGLADKIVPKPKRGNLRKLRNKHMSEPIDKRRMKQLLKEAYESVDLDIGVKDVIFTSPVLDEADPDVVVDNTPVPTTETDKKS